MDLGIATGYNHFFGKDNDGIENNDFGVVPVAGLIRVYPKQTGFYFGTDLGYAFITGDENVATNALLQDLMVVSISKTRIRMA